MKTTKANFEYYKSECTKWINYFGLVGWDIDYEHSDKNNFDTLYLSYIARDGIEHRRCTFGLTVDWDKTKITKNEIAKCAFHEVLHLMFARIEDIGESRYISRSEISEELHNLIAIFENTLFKHVEIK